MKIFKNPVGRPPKNLKKKRMITVIVIALVILLGGTIATISILGVDMSSLMGNSVVSSKTSVISGELTSDGVIDEEDYTFLEELAYQGMYLVNGDINLDGLVDKSDVEALRKYLDSEIKTQYKIKFDANGGQGKMPSPVKVLSGTEIELPTNNYTKNGYIFTGWTGSDGKEYVDAQTGVILTSDITVTAKWESISEIVEESREESNLAVEGEITKEETTTEEATTEEENATMPEASVEEAKKTLEMIFDGDAGSIGTMANQVITYGTDTTIAKNRYKKVGYTFKGWKVSGVNGRYLGCTDGKSCAYTANNSTLKWYQESDIKDYLLIPDNMIITGKVQEILENTIKNGEKVTLKAAWEANKYKVTYNAGQGKFANTNASRNNSYMQQVPYLSQYILPPTEPTREGYDFAGWYTKVNGKGEEISKDSVLKDAVNRVIYAKWKNNKIIITYDANGGTINGKSSMKWMGKNNNNYKLVGYKPIRKGYTFRGWYSHKKVGVRYESGTSLKTEKNARLYAQWARNYTVEYNSGGGTGTMAKQEIGYGIVTATRINKFKKLGHTFAGWKVKNKENGLYIGCTNNSECNDQNVTKGWYPKNKIKNYRLYQNGIRISKTITSGKTVVFEANWNMIGNNNIVNKLKVNGDVNYLSYKTVKLKRKSAVMQSFAILGNDIYISQKQSDVSSSKWKFGGTLSKINDSQNFAVLANYGHMANIDIEQTENDYYLWTDCNGYLICRVPLKNINFNNVYSSSIPAHGQTRFNKKGLVAVDSINRILIILSGSTRYHTFSVYNLDDFINTDGKTNYIYKFTKDNDNGIYSRQGIEVDGNYIYSYEGNNNKESEYEKTYISVFTLDGKTVVYRKEIKKPYTASDTYWEPEGIKVYNGNLYFGFARIEKNDDKVAEIYRLW